MSSQRALESCLDRCENAGRDAAPAADVRQLLKLCRDAKVRLPEVVARHGLRLLERSSKSLKDEELWLIHEQVCLALLDTGDIDEAKKVVLKLSRRFPKSLRVGVLEGTLCECCEDFDKAEEIYRAILEENEVHQGAWKRLSCVYKAKGDTRNAIDVLKKYLDVFMTDAEAWEELAFLYLLLQMTKQARFCYEELILIQPQNPIHHLRYADLLYTLSTSSTLHLLHQAIGYYGVVLDLTNGSSVHAMYGVLCCADSIRSQGRGAQGKLGDEEQALVSKVSTKLLHLYENNQANLVAHVKNTNLLSSA